MMIFAQLINDYILLMVRFFYCCANFSYINSVVEPMLLQFKKKFMCSIN